MPRDVELRPRPRSDEARDTGPASESASGSSRGNRTLLACLLICVAAFVGTDALAKRSEAFWRLAEQSAQGSEDAALALEARAHRLAEKPRLAALVMGSSVADSNYALDVMAQALREPSSRVDKLWMPAMSGLELAMLAPTVRQLRPERIYVPVLPLLMIDEVRWDRTRTYSPRVAARLFPLGELFTDRHEHGARALAASHVVVRRRSELRRALLGSYRDVSAMPTEAPPRIDEQLSALRRARDTDFRCDAIHLRALRIFADGLREDPERRPSATRGARWCWPARRSRPVRTPGATPSPIVSSTVYASSISPPPSCARARRDRPSTRGTSATRST